MANGNGQLGINPLAVHPPADQPEHHTNHGRLDRRLVQVDRCLGRRIDQAVDGVADTEFQLEEVLTKMRFQCVCGPRPEQLVHAIDRDRVHPNHHQRKCPKADPEDVDHAIERRQHEAAHTAREDCPRGRPYPLDQRTEACRVENQP